MLLELRVHVPAQLLSRRLRVVELFLRNPLQRFKLGLEQLEILIGVIADDRGDTGVNSCWLLRDGNH